MSLSENTQYWLERQRAEVAAIPSGEWWVIAAMLLAKVEFAYGLDPTARATLRRCLERFDLLQPGTWNSHAREAAQLCGRLSENQWLEPEVRRGLNWLSQPEVVNYQGESMRQRVLDLAIQTGRADVAAELTSSAWPGRAANQLVDACGLAGWAKDAAEMGRLLPRARAAIEAAGPAPQWGSGTLGYRLVRACVFAGLLAELPELCKAFGYPADEAVIALGSAPDRPAYAQARDGWLTNRIERFRIAPDNHHWHSSAVRHAAETIRRLGDADGYAAAIRHFRDVVLAWNPNWDSFACAAHCDLAVLYGNAQEARISAEHLDAAKRLFDGKEPGVPTARGNRSLMATILSDAYRYLGETDLALRFAKRSTHKDDRQACIVHALILGGRVAEAEVELAKLDEPRDRAVKIGYVLLSEFRVSSSSEVILCRKQLP
ncbi:MAG: hypothetical protein L0211_18615 [Planctomycetaceae bacterium]|nr:hypothetical protein [Planctomycetaceae bacterium]